MVDTWTRSLLLPERRFGDEWLGLEPDSGRLLVVRGAPAVVAIELLAQPRDLGDVVARIEEAVGASLAEGLHALFGELRTSRRLVRVETPAIAVGSLRRIANEPIAIFEEALGSLFHGLSAPSHPGSASLLQNGNGTPCGR